MKLDVENKRYTPGFINKTSNVIKDIGSAKGTRICISTENNGEYNFHDMSYFRKTRIQKLYIFDSWKT